MVEPRADTRSGHRLSPRHFRTGSRGGGYYSEAVNQYTASYIAAACGRLHIHPTVLTLGNMVLGTLSSLALALSAAKWAAVLALLGWQVAYTLDCADGQLARGMAQTSGSGARLDVLADFIVKATFVTAVSVAAARTSEVEVAVLVLYAATAFEGLLLATLTRERGDGMAHRLLPSSTLLFRLLKLSRDPGFMLLVFGLVVVFRAGALHYLIWIFLALHILVLVGSVAKEAIGSVHPS